MHVARLAERQAGVAARWQLVALGLGRGAVAHRVRAGRLHRVHEGVYAVGHRALTPFGLLVAAVLAAGPLAVLSHHAAAFLWGIAEPVPPPVDLIVPGRARRSTTALRSHRHALAPGETARRHGLPVTTVARTLLDLAAVVPPARHERLVGEAFAQRLVTRAQLLAVLEAHPHTPGAGPLRTALEVAGEDTRSALERRFLRLVRDAGLPAPEVNPRLGEWRPDLVWSDRRVVVELDGHAAHSSPWAHDRDRRKDLALRRAGYTVLRFSARQVRREPLAVLTDVVRALG